MKNQKIRTVVAFEPGSSYAFPEGEVPPPLSSANSTVQGVAIPLPEFKRLTLICGASPKAGAVSLGCCGEFGAGI